MPKSSKETVLEKDGLHRCTFTKGFNLSFLRFQYSKEVLGLVAYVVKPVDISRVELGKIEPKESLVD